MTLEAAIAIIVTTTLLAYIGVARVRHHAWKRQLLDIPNERSSHQQPTPRGGGVMIVVLTLGGVLLLAPGTTRLAGYLAGGFIIALISGWDDIHPLTTRLRFATHGLVAALVIGVVGYWHSITLPLFGAVTLGWFGILVTWLWLVGLVNAYNFMDGIDGLAATQAVFAGLGWSLLGWYVDEQMVTYLGLLVLSSSLGFLFHNWPPARIFMGDVGSAFLGYTFAVIPLFLPESTSLRADGLVLAVLLLWPFLFDTIFTFIHRWRQGEDVFAAHRSHLYQRLTIVGYSHRAVTMGYSVLMVTGIMLAWLWWRDIVIEAIPIILLLLAATVWRVVVQLERTQTSRGIQ
ncbi:MAG: glycosyltransferase family 4 protein [Anaerolineales bacterium]|nr:glycosyltransferase family 4 protein [Anaerolineales bacterium]